VISSVNIVVVVVVVVVVIIIIIIIIIIGRLIKKEMVNSSQYQLHVDCKPSKEH